MHHPPNGTSGRVEMFTPDVDTHGRNTSGTIFTMETPSYEPDDGAARLDPPTLILKKCVGATAPSGSGGFLTVTWPMVYLCVFGLFRKVSGFEGRGRVHQVGSRWRS